MIDLKDLKRLKKTEKMEEMEEIFAFKKDTRKGTKGVQNV